VFKHPFIDGKMNLGEVNKCCFKQVFMFIWGQNRAAIECLKRYFNIEGYKNKDFKALKTGESRP